VRAGSLVNLGLEGQACAVTGASSGVGLEVARELCSEGARVLLVARRPDRLEDAVASCRFTGGGEARGLAVDITSPHAAEEVVCGCHGHFGGIDVLVNNAGRSRTRPLLELSEQDWHEQWELNVGAPRRLMTLAAEAMAQRGSGRIVNVSSSSGKRPGQNNAAYSVTKAAQLALSRVFADAYAARGVLVNAVTPGPLASEMWLAEGGLADQYAEARGVDRQEALAQMARRIPRGQLGSSQEVAAVIVFLCSAAAANVAGAAWSVDGGYVPFAL